MIALDIIYPLARAIIMETYGSYLPNCIRMDSSELRMEAVIDIRGYGIPMMQQIWHMTCLMLLVYHLGRKAPACFILHQLRLAVAFMKISRIDVDGIGQYTS